MAYASRSGRARTSASNPQAHAICDRCGFRWNFSDLKWQYDWRGAALQNLRILVCNSCYDTPQEQLRAIVVPADPTPIINARPENYVADSTNYQTITQPSAIDPNTGIPIPGTTTLATQNGLNLLTQEVGPPVGLDQNDIMPLNQGVKYGTVLPVLSVFSVGTDRMTVTCSAPHGLSTNSQVSVSGVSKVKACGFYSVTVTTATAFTYQTNTIITAGSLLGANTRIVTVLVGIPYGDNQIPKTGI